MAVLDVDEIIVPTKFYDLVSFLDSTFAMKPDATSVALGSYYFMPVSSVITEQDLRLLLTALLLHRRQVTLFLDFRFPS